jgi:anaerobic selenocysteine-containing dehydrogenase/Fe-S-cluster-containing dehydrogenase component
MDNNPSRPEPATSPFTPPKHWVDPVELDQKYWLDAKVSETRGQEFFEKPVEWLDKVEKNGEFGLARRDFLGLMGASMAMAGFSCARRPVHKIIPYVIQPEEITPGVPLWYASTSVDCGHGCGILVRNREGRPVKLEGNPDHPANRGALCSRGQASLLSLYDPERLKQPVGRGRVANGGRQELSWNDADSAIAGRLKAGSRVAVLSPTIYSESTLRLVREFLGAFNSGRLVEFDALDNADVAAGQENSYGAAVIPQYHFDRADVVLSLGADFLGTWISPIEFAKDWSKTRKLDSKKHQTEKMSKLFVFEPNFSVTGANADERHPLRAGDELKIALAVAHELIVKGGRSRFAGDSAVTETLSGYKAETVAQEIGIDGGAEVIKRVANALWEVRGKGLVVAGGIQSRTPTAEALQVAVNLLNSALENEGSTVDGSGEVRAHRSSFAAVAKLVADMNAGAIDALIIYRSNAAYTLPKTVGFEQALKKVPLVIYVGDREDETGLLADYVLPDHHYLENWGDLTMRKGVTSLQQPAMAPIHGTRAFQDTLLTWIKGAGLKTASLSSRIALAASKANTWHDYLKANWRESLVSSEKAWEEALRKGVVETRVSGGARSFRSSAMSSLPKYTARLNPGIVLSLFESVGMGDGREANNPWLQELPDPVSSVTWDNFVSIGSSLAKRLHLSNDDVVEIKAENGAVAELPVRIQPGMHPSAIAVAVGYGRRAAGKVGTEAGVDVFPFITVQGDKASFSGQFVELRKTGRFYRLAATQWHTVTENRPIINDITFAEFKKDPATESHTDPHLRLKHPRTLWTKHEYKHYRWGMAIDLNSCIGCNACMVACQSENNIPVVGRDNVRVGRQMHWIRIDRYYSGNVDHPSVVFQPMLCQHCENAPCETVCPVLATVHDDEGTSTQAYNRCVGTRYCQNNCPYKVRRFNFFDHWKSYEGPMNMVWNPDVTVRTRGIMEKCSFCIQRITFAKDKAKDEKRKVIDGELKSACQQSCPTDAITFGDINDPNTRVSQLKADARQFRALEDLNTQPAISYLTKVRNIEVAEAAHGNDHH